MNNNENDEMLEQLKLNIAAYKFKEEQKLNTLENKEKGGIFYMKKKIIMAACACLVLVSGIVAATAIKNSKSSDRGLGEGVDTAVDNGYIANPNADGTDSNAIGTNKETTVDNINATINIEDFIMDDVNLSTQILFKFDDKIKEVVNLDKVNAIELTDLIVRDEENKIIYGGNNEERFKKYCEENSLNYTFCEFNDNYMNCGVNSFNVMNDRESNSIKIMYNMYTSGTYPKSKKLYFSFGKIEMLEFNPESATQNRVIVNGNWDISVDVPKEMYTRADEYYKVVSCDNPDFDVYTAKVTNTGFEIGVIISNIEKPEDDREKRLKFYSSSEDYENGKISKEELEELKQWFASVSMLYYPISVSEHNIKGEEVENSYIENEQSKKFYTTSSSSRKAKTYFIDGNKYDFYETFSMTKYDMTSKIKVVLYYYGIPVTINMERIK